jgi:hypothetical protein
LNFYPFLSSTIKMISAANQAAQYPQIHCSIFLSESLDLPSGGTNCYFLNFLLKMARPANPQPTISMVAGSGTG